MESQRTTHYRKLVDAIVTGDTLPAAPIISNVVRAAGHTLDQLEADVAAERKERGFPETSPRSRPGTNFATR